jgi:glycosyl hydrolase family 39 (putative alpha-L-iduronidase)
MIHYKISTTTLFAIVMSFLLSAPEGTAPLLPPQQIIPQSFFGMHIHHTNTTTPWPSVPVAEWRLWDAYVTWPYLEPHKGQFRFDTLDAYVSLARQHNTGILLPLALSPPWASARPLEKSAYQPGSAAEPRVLQDWRDFVRAVVTRYRGRIKAYEIWNEPNLSQFCSASVDQILVLTREASQIIHEVDPTALVVSPSATESKGLAWLSEFLTKGGGQYVDVIGYHLYVNPLPPEAMVSLVQQIRQIMANNGQAAKPVWNTEANWFSPKPFPSQELAASYLARSFILNWAAGVQRLYWYAWDNRAVQVVTTQQDNRTLTPAGRAYGTVYLWLVGARMDNCQQDANHTFVCQLNRDGALQWIVWNPDGPRAFNVPSAWNITSVTPLLDEPRAFTNPVSDIGPLPVLLSASLNR